MIIQGHEVPSGWPFGLGSMNTRLSVRESGVAVTGGREPNTFHGPSSSFSSFSSSNLDTESTASFFQDNSVSLGRLIGIAPRENRTLYFPRTTCIPDQRSQRSKVSTKAHEIETSHGICVPNLLNILVKISRSKSHTRQ
ncbi:uncharacterized protein LOC112526797 [Cynara cardunculus var. scolymus]|uniref:Uncharacterized protein n=1 Tax=Cynara cardunculus var. scolymus TaxID=59895 RepID=A0A118JTA2_CYNCS|nr:uncharacterized protein LOC112526797 [Cynara cardunculus var. scolymus]KVH89502.1 hypothetical protein Ccrd_008501 [Cynara cardunculus var. scolymus]